MNTTGVYDPVRKIFRRITNPHVHRGTADIIGVKKGTFFAIEVKTPLSIKKKHTLHDLEQTAFLQRITRASGNAVRLCSLDDAIKFFHSI